MVVDAVDEPDSQTVTITSHRGAPTITDGVSVSFSVNSVFDSYGSTFSGQVIKTINTAPGDQIDCVLSDSATTTYWGSSNFDIAT